MLAVPCGPGDLDGESRMILRPLGHTGVRVSPLAMGCLNLGSSTPEAESVRMVHRAMDAGILLFDTADVYGDGASEEVLGRALAGGRRDRIVLASKGHFPTSTGPNDAGNSRRHLIRAVEGSLRRLRTDHIDLYQIHRPDALTPLEETLRALDDLVSQGKIRYVGTSTFPAWILMEAIAISERRGWVRFVTEQPPYNLLDRRIEVELLPMARSQNLGLITWSPLAMGMLAGRYASASAPPEGSRVARLGGIYAERVTKPAIERAGMLAELARAAGLDPACMALAWVCSRSGITSVLLGPRTEEQLESALNSLETEISPELKRQIDAVVPPGTAATDFLNNPGVRAPSELS